MNEERIKEFITKRFPLARARGVRNDDPLLESGIVDSLGILDLVSYLEEEFDISVEDDELVPDNFQNIARLATFISEKQSS